MRRVLLDENLPRLFKLDLPGFDVSTVSEAGWAGTKDGELLHLAERDFEVFITADRNLPHQQNLPSLSLRVIVLVVRSTKLEDIRPIAPAICKAINQVELQELIYIPSA